MRRVNCLGFALLLGVGILLLATSSAPVQAGDAAMVANQQTCTIFFGANVYDGSGTEVLTPSGDWKYTCNASLTSGPGATKTEHADGVCFGSLGAGVGDFLEDPGGEAHADCHN